MIHRDIKPQNLLLTGPLPPDELNDPSKSTKEEELRQQNGYSHRFRLKIADFGFARHLKQTSLADTLCGSPLYMAPEMLKYQRYDYKADLWSTGAVLFEMITGKPPFNGDNHLQLLNNIQSKVVRLPADVKVSPECVNLMRILLQRNPMQRADFRQFREAAHAFVELKCLGSCVDGSAAASVIPVPGVHVDVDDTIGANQPTNKNCTDQNHFRQQQQQQQHKKPTCDGVHQDATHNSEAARSHISILPHPVAVAITQLKASSVRIPTQSPASVQMCEDACFPQQRKLPQNQNPSPMTMNITPESSREDATTDTVSETISRSSARMSFHDSSFCIAIAASASSSSYIYAHTKCNEQAVRKLVEAETLGRRAVHVAQVGDARAHLAIMQQQRHILANGVTCIPLECNCTSNACAPANECGSSSLSLGTMSGIEIVFSKCEKLYEALSCYLKALEVMRMAIKMIQEVVTTVESSASVNDEDNYNFLERCKFTLVWLFRQFNEVLERADASKAEIGKLNLNFRQSCESLSPLTSGVNVHVDMLLYNAATSHGKDGALKQFLGRYHAAMACYKSAILLFGVLLMKVDLPEQDRNLLWCTVDNFTGRIKRLQEINSSQSNLS